MAGTGRDQYHSNFSNKFAVSASPGFTWGKSGNITAGTWMENDTVPSNVSGRAVYIYNATIQAVYVRCENAATFDIEVYEHDGTTYTLVHTTNVVAVRAFDEIIVTPPSVTNGKELAIKIVNGSCKNATVGLQLNGTLEP